MLERGLTGILVAAALGSGVTAGIFFAFSTFVMAALGRVSADQGVAVMRAINVTVLNPLFMLAFMGTALACALLAAGSLVVWSGPAGKLALAGALIYLMGCLAATMVFNVPLNERLANASPGQLVTLWPHYLKAWTNWNHVRTIAPLASMALFIAALMARP